MSLPTCQADNAVADVNTKSELLEVPPGTLECQLALCNEPLLESKHPTFVQKKVGREAVLNSMRGDVQELSCSEHHEQHDSGNSGQKICTKHHQDLVLKREKVRKWKLCKSGVYRNVFESKKTWICPGNYPYKITKPLNLTSGEGVKGKQIPAKLFQIFEKRKRT